MSQPTGDRTRLARRSWVPYCVLVVTLLLSLVAAHSVANLNETRERIRFGRVAEQTRLQLQQIINGYLNVLDGLRGLVNARLTMDRPQFEAYLEPVRLRENYPGVQGLGIAVRVRPDQKELGIRKAREKEPNFHIWPVAKEGEVCPLVICAPADARNLELVGFDLYSDPVAREALERGTRAARPTVSGQFELAREQPGPREFGFLFCTPVFVGGVAPETVPERQEKLFGFLVCLFRAGDLFLALDKSVAGAAVALRLHDGAEPARARLLHAFPSVTGASQPWPPTTLAATNSLLVADRAWTLAVAALPEFATGPARFLPRALALGGGLISLALFGLTLGQVKAHAETERHGEARRLAEAKFRLLVEQSIVGIYMIQGDRFTYVNPKMMEIFGCSGEELTNRPIFEFIAEESREAARENIRRRLHGEVRSVHYFLRALRHDGQAIDVEAHGGLVDFEGEPAILGCLIDITGKKRAEQEIRELNASLEERVRQRTTELEAANRELDSFCHSVSHDLRAPLRAIDGFSQILAEDHQAQLNKDGQRYLACVLTATKRMAELIEDLLKLSRVTRTELCRLPVDLSEIAAQVIANLRSLDTAREVEFVVTGGLAAEGDPRLLRNVMENLLGNAWKFTAKTAQARIEFGATRDEAGKPVFFVRDNGAGFDMTYAHKLFGTFQRLHHTDDFPGTGVGLATVQRIITRHGGRIWAEGALNQGATFSFTL